MAMKTQKSSPSLVFLQSTGTTGRTQHNSCPEQRASAKAPAFPSWENSISPQVAQQTHRLLPEEIKYLNKKKVVHFSHVWRETQWIKIIQCHHELALKKHRVYSEWIEYQTQQQTFFSLKVEETQTIFQASLKIYFKTLKGVHLDSL